MKVADNPYYKKYLEAIRYNPTVAQFDDDWEPIGPKVRADLLTAGLIEEREGKLFNRENEDDSAS